MRVYRLEDADGLGPWWSERTAELAAELLPHCEDYLTYPTLQLEELPRGDGWYAAARSPEEFADWFPEQALRELAAWGHRPKVFEVDPEFVVSGAAQCVFRRDMAREVAQ